MGNTDPTTLLYLTYLNDGLGMDVKEVGWTVSMCIEAYEKGRLTNAQTGGLELKWGNTQAVETLLGQIARREPPLGNILAEGLVRSGELLEIKDLANYAKGQGTHVIGVQSMPYNAFDFSVSEICSGQGNMGGMFSADPETKNRSLNVNVPGVATPILVSTVSKTHILNCLVMCFFNANLGTPPVLFEPHICDCIRAATGWNDYTKDEALDLSERLINLSRVYNIRNGLTVADDIPSEKVFLPCSLGPNTGTTLKPGYMGLLKTYYRFMGWDDRTGKPTRTTLKKLGLEDCIKYIWS
jgi:aldehyde:ferredoxin oxidoreductase